MESARDICRDLLSMQKDKIISFNSAAALIPIDSVITVSYLSQMKTGLEGTHPKPLRRRGT